MLVLGYDPGGKQANGVAALNVAASVSASTQTCRDVNHSLSWFRESSQGQRPDAIGIDSPLSWSTHGSGMRAMDHILRRAYPAVRLSVVPTNAARGAMVVQGMAAALELKKIWNAIRLNETHPKVLYYALAKKRYEYGPKMTEWLLSVVRPLRPVSVSNEHEWDALLSAWATLQGITGAWTEDLMLNAQALLFPAGPVNYFWPQQLQG